jgi:hypothetical protein
MVSQTGQGTRTSHNLKNKQWMIQHVTKNPQQDYKLYMQAYQQQFKLKLAKSTLSKWLKQKAKINSVPVKQAAKIKHIKAPLYVELEQLIVAWLSQVSTVGLCQCQATGIYRTSQHGCQHSLGWRLDALSIFSACACAD